MEAPTLLRDLHWTPLEGPGTPIPTKLHSHPPGVTFDGVPNLEDRGAHYPLTGWN